jgi:hypothetical protein
LAWPEPGLTNLGARHGWADDHQRRGVHDLEVGAGERVGGGALRRRFGWGLAVRPAASRRVALGHLALALAWPEPGLTISDEVSTTSKSAPVSVFSASSALLSQRLSCVPPM